MTVLWDFDPCCNDREYFSSKYNGTIMLLAGVPMPISVSDSRAAVGENVFDFNVSGIELGLAPFLPSSCWIQDDRVLRAPVYMRRLPKRQWHRSMHRDQYQYTTPYLKGWVVRGYDNYASRLEVAQQIVSKATKTIQEAVHKLRRSKTMLGYVLNRDFALVRNTEYVYNLCNSVGVVGLVVADKGLILVNASLYQEVLDFLSSTKETEWNVQVQKYL